MCDETLCLIPVHTVKRKEIEGRVMGFLIH